VLAASSKWVHREYDKVMRDLRATHALAHDLDVCVEQGNEQRAELLREHGEREIAYQSERAELEREIERQQHEIAKRASFRWWFLLPWRRALLALKGKPPWS
jgi:hypothetical protein